MPDVREKLVELLRSVPRREEVSIGRGCGKSFVRLGIIADHLIANGVTFAEDKNVLTNGVTIQRWIPVTERFPDAEYGESENVLTYNEFGMEHILYFDGGCWCYPDGEVYDKLFHITHWMPLPEPPKEE